MKNLISILIGLGMFVPTIVQAADETPYISLFDGTPQASDKKEKVKETEEDKKEGIFSFLNFSFSKEKAIETITSSNQTLSEIERLTQQAKAGDVNAMLTLGYSYLYGDNGVKVDYDKAFEYYAQAAMKNDNVGLNNLGSLYYSGIGIKRSIPKAAVLFEKAANLGNTEAAVNLAFILITGNGVKEDSAQAMDLFEKAAKEGNPTASFMTGYAYYSGKLRPKDYAKAFPLIRVAAQNNYDEAQYVLAQMYLNGWGVPQNYNNAVKYLHLAAGQGNVPAMLELGNIYALGEKYTKDLASAHILFNLAAVRGANNAVEKRDMIEQKLKMNELLQAQTEAENFKEKPSELTSYIKKTFGPNIKSYIDKAGI